jgi:hypothetical protein
LAGSFASHSARATTSILDCRDQALAVALVVLQLFRARSGGRRAG